MPFLIGHSLRMSEPDQSESDVWLSLRHLFLLFSRVISLTCDDYLLKHTKISDNFKMAEKHKQKYANVKMFSKMKLTIELC